MSLYRIIGTAAGVVLVLVGLGLGYLWTACRAYVFPDKCLVLIHKTGEPMPAGQKIAEEGQKGIQRRALGPGRYFYNPWVWDWELHNLLEIPAGDPQTWREVYAAGDPDYQVPTIEGSWPQVGIVTSLAGKPWDQESEVVDAGYQGIQREVLTPRDLPAQPAGIPDRVGRRPGRAAGLLRRGDLAARRDARHRGHHHNRDRSRRRGRRG